MSSPEAKSKTEDVGASVIGEAEHSEPSGNKTALDDEADTSNDQDDTSKLKPSAAQQPDAKDETTAEQPGSKSLHELGFTDEQIAAIMSSTEVASLKSGSNASDDEVAHLKSLSAALVQTRDTLNRNFQGLGDSRKIFAMPPDTRRLVSSAQEAISSLSRLVRSRGLQEKFIDEMDDWSGRGPVQVQESQRRSPPLMINLSPAQPPATRGGAVHQWRNTVPIGAPKADVVRPATKSKGKMFGFWPGKSD